MFQTFWELYPRKVAKRAAEKAWNKLSKQDQEEALKALPNHIKYWQLKDTEKEYICHAQTWLNQGRWEDEIDLAPTVAKKPQIPWYSNDELTLAKGRELGINPHPGETMGQYRSRLQASMHSQATNSVAQNMGTSYLSQIYNKNKV
jgi:hypothetical protein